MYWIQNPIEDEVNCVRVLEDVKCGSTLNHTKDRFNIAYLIAIECLQFNSNTSEITITEKGIECIEVFKK